MLQLFKESTGSSSMLAVAQAIRLRQLLQGQQQRQQRQIITTTWAVRLAIVVVPTVALTGTTTAVMAGAVQQLQPAGALQPSMGSTMATIHLLYRQVNMHMYCSRRQVIKRSTSAVQVSMQLQLTILPAE
jgi:hypothetical protein